MSSFEERAEKLANGHSDILLGGSIQLIGLNTIIDESKKNNINIVKYAQEITEKIIYNNITTDDFFEKYNEETFVIVFGKLNKEQAEIKTKYISDKIRNKLEKINELSKLDVSFTVSSTNKNEIKSRQGLIIDVIADTLQKVKNEVANAIQILQNSIIKDAKIIFSPVWNPNLKKIYIYRCIISLGESKRHLEHLQSIGNYDDLRMVLFDLDVFILGKSLEALHNIFNKHGRISILIPINFNSINYKHTRDKFINFCQDIPQSYKKYILFELHSVPNGTPFMKLTDIFGILKRNSNAVILSVNKEVDYIHKLSEMGIYGISLDANLFYNNQKESKIFLKKLSAKVHYSRLKIFLTQANTIGFVESAIHSNIDYVDGKGISLPLSSLKSYHSWNLPQESPHP